MTDALIESGEWRKLKRKAVSGVMLRLFLIIMLSVAFSLLPAKAELKTVEVSSDYHEIQAASGSSDSWVWVRDTITGAWGEAVVGTGDAIYIARKSSFYRYRPADNSWAVLAAPPNPDAGDAFKTGTALAWDFGDYIYALCGAATDDSRRWFYRYSISGNSWQALANTPYDQGEGDTTAWVGLDNRIYATIGGEQRATYFLRYDPSANTWSDAEVADPPAGMGDGASLVWTGGELLYALRGEFYEESPTYDFWRYNITSNIWTVMADIPAYPHDGGVGGVGDGGSLLYIGLWLSNQTDFIYALSGNQAYPESPQPIPDNRFYCYTIATDSWERLADLPFGVGYYVGCRLGYADGYIYAWQGTPSTWTGGGDDLAYYEFPALAEIHDVAVVSIVPSTSEAYAGQIVNITVVIGNEGDFTETFNVSAYASLPQILDIIRIQTQIVTNLAPASQTTLTFTWNTAGVTLGNYTISAETSVIPGEIDTEDNINIDGIVWVKSDSMPPDRSMDWLMFQHDPQHTGYSTERVSEKLFCLWKFEADGTPSSPVIANDRLFFVTTTGSVYCLDAVTGNEIWKHETGQSAGFHPFSVAAVNGRVYVCADNVYCLNATSGDRIWTYSTPEGYADSPLTVVGDKLYVGADLGGVFCINATNGFKIWGHETSVWLHSSPAVNDGRVYVGFGGESKICCFNADNGTLIWSSSPNWDFDPQTPTVVEARVYVGSQGDHKIHCFNVIDGSEIWSFKTGDLIVSSPAVAYGRVYIGSWDYIFYCFNATEGSLLWTYGTNGEIESSPAVADGKVFVVSNDGHIYCLNVTNGNKIWSYEIGYKSSFTKRPCPAISRGKVYLNSWDGNIYCFGEDTSPPLISITSPISGEILGLSSVTVSWFVYDTQSGIDHSEVKLDGGSWISTGTATNYTFTNVTEGSHMITVRAFNGAGNTSETSVSFGVDVTPPSISIASPTNATIFSSSSVLISWSGFDTVSGIDHYEVRLNAGSWLDVQTSTTHTFTNLDDGTHMAYVRVFDKGANVKEASVNFFVDTTSPSISITSPANGSELKSSDVVIIWSGSDQTSGIDHYEVRIDDGSWTNIGSQTTYYTFSGLNDGSHIADVKAIDKAGLTQVASVKFIVNTSLVGGPGWIDDATVLGGIITLVALGITMYILKIRKKTSK